MCNYPDCKTYSNFNFEGETKRLYCSRHKLDGMINLLAKKCSYKGCETMPIFNFLFYDT